MFKFGEVKAEVQRHKITTRVTVRRISEDEFVVEHDGKAVNNIPVRMFVDDTLTVEIPFTLSFE